MTIAEKLTRAKTDYDEVYESGKKAEYDEFWTDYQKGNYTWSANGMFSGARWSRKTFKPKYDIRGFDSALNMFWANAVGGDLAALLEELGVTLDFSNTKNASQAFSYSKFTRLGILDFRKATTAANVFENMSNLVTIDKIIVSESTTISAWFSYDDKLENVTFEGTIAKNGLNLQWSTKLNKASITSVINCLSTTTSGLTVTLSKVAVNKAFETSEGANDGTTSTEWTSLIGTRSNWTISLV
jgi:hypothetical protein